MYEKEGDAGKTQIPIMLIGSSNDVKYYKQTNNRRVRSDSQTYISSRKQTRRLSRRLNIVRERCQFVSYMLLDWQPDRFIIF